MRARLLLYACAVVAFTWIAVGLPQQGTPAAALADPVALNSPFWQQPSALAPAMVNAPRADDPSPGTSSWKVDRTIRYHEQYRPTSEERQQFKESLLEELRKQSLLSLIRTWKA